MDKVNVPETASGVAEAPVDAAKAEIDPSVISAGLSKIRRRRWVVWIVMIIYLPTMWTTQKITHSFNASMPVFFVWFLLLLIAMGYSAVARCPRCGNYYHVNGMILLYLRKCLHCQLPLNEDKTPPKF
jgi:uncharacterized membrane protein YadS